MGERFLELSAEERASLTRTALRQGLPLLSRWQDIGDDFGLNWRPRTDRAAKYLRGAKRVVDLGCGAMTLEGRLSPKQVYIPVDLCRRDARTIVLDFNKRWDLERLPAADACALLGVVEYAYDPPALMAALARSYPRVVVSYSVLAQGETEQTREASGWVNHLAFDEFKELIEQHGFRITRRSRLKYKRAEYIFELRRS